MHMYALGFLPILTMMAFADDFATARTKISEVKPNIDYSTFCSAKPGGKAKIACRIKSVPTVALLVCQKPVFDGRNCSTAIYNEMNNLQILKREGKVKTVAISPPPIHDVSCGKDASLNCSGFLEEWVASEKGKFKHLRDHVIENQVLMLIKDVKDFTQKAGLETTAQDLANIKKYMMEDPSAGKYRQICDLQGFFLLKGGFLINDVPNILNNATIDEKCGNGEPTTKQYLDTLDEMIRDFRTETSGGIIISSPNVHRKCLFIAIVIFCIAPLL